MTEQISNVNVPLKANIYFDGKVVSHTLLLPQGGKKTIGLIYPGEYTFDTGAAERLEILAGECRVRLPGQTQWTACGAGQSFSVPAKSCFAIAVASGIAEYLCSYEG